MKDSGLELVAISVGNTRTRLGLFRGKQLEHSDAVGNEDPAAIAGAAAALPVLNPGTPVVMASVNEPVALRVLEALQPRVRERGGEVYRFGEDLAIPIANALTDDSTVGQDRLLNAIGAFSRAGQACIVIDAGTAITVDFVDGQGVFQGGAIAPGVSMMLRALSERTAALPRLAFERTGPDSPLGKDTRGAMLLGVQSAAVGMSRVLIDRYAEFYGAYPQIIATGGDARTLFEGDELVEHIVPELTLLGIEAACRIHLGRLDGEESDDEG